MPYYPARAPVDFIFDVLAGRVEGYTTINKFGRAPDGVQTTATDIWNRADSTPTQQIWVAPTQARVHAIVSSDGGDTSAGAGAKTVLVYGLTDWDTAETNEIITMAGVTPVNTVNSYVIIYRMRVVTSGATARNIGTITATAATDSTITSVMLATEGTTKMAIYGIPSTKCIHLTRISASIQKSSGVAVDALVRVLVNPEPDVQLTNFNENDVHGLQSTGVSTHTWEYFPYDTIVGPAIIKMNCISSNADTDMTAGFAGFLVDN